MNEYINVKIKIPWPQNQVLSGSTRSRPSYDQLNVFQWVLGFARIAQDESDLEVKKRCIPIFGFCKSLIGNVWQRLKNYGYQNHLS